MQGRCETNGAGQDGYNCLYIALRQFPFWAAYTNKELRDIAAAFIERGEYGDRLLSQGLYGGVNAAQIVEGVRGRAWGTNLVLDALCREKGQVVFGVHTTPKGDVVTRYPATGSLRVGEAVHSLDEFRSFTGAVVLNTSNLHYTSLVTVCALRHPFACVTAGVV